MIRRKSTSPFDSHGRQKHGDDNSDDRISDLPDPIIGQILSLLPTKIAVATGVLSKRWKFLWTNVGNLDLRFKGGYVEAEVEQFVKSVNYVMLLHKPAGCFNKLSLIWVASPIPLYVNTWIYSALTRDVQELVVHVCTMHQFPLHVKSCLFSNKKLKSLELTCKPICISPETEVSLPRLETLKLTASFQSEDEFSKLLDGCPLLKHLCISIRTRIVGFKCIISSASLKHLELEDSSAPCSVHLDAPLLEYIKLWHNIRGIVIQQRLNLLCEAYVHICVRETRPPDYCNSYVKALDALSSTKTLHLPVEVTRALSCATIKMQASFNRLTTLNVSISPNRWSSIQNFIELSDNLEVLTIYKDMDLFHDEGPSDNPNWTNPSVVPKCLSNSLKTVLFGGCEGDPVELGMIEYIIKHGSVLKSMEIQIAATLRRLNRVDEQVQLISNFPRKSSICQVTFTDYNDGWW